MDQAAKLRKIVEEKKEETLFELYKENVCTFVERSMKKNKIRHL